MKYSVWDLDIKNVIINSKGTVDKPKPHGVIEFACGTVVNIDLLQEATCWRIKVSRWKISNPKILAYVFNELFNKLLSKITIDNKPAWNLDSYETGIVFINNVGDITSYQITEHDINLALEDFWGDIDEVIMKNEIGKQKLCC